MPTWRIVQPWERLNRLFWRTIEPLDQHHLKILLPLAIFFLTVINVLLYSKYPMALDRYAVR
jgi:hypothetical protein